MLHQFNYATPLSHFLNLHQLQQQSVQQSQHCSNDSSNNSVLSPTGSLCDDPNSSLLDPRYNGKDLSAASVSKSSFTIAAILGLSNEMAVSAKETAADVMPTDLSAVMNLSIHNPEENGGGGDGGGPGRVTDFSRLSHPGHPGLGSSSQCVSSSNAIHHHNGHQQQLFNTPSAAVASRSVNACTQRTTDRGGGVGGLKHLTNAVLHGGCKKTAKSKRVRTIFTPEQLERLEAEFERQQYMVGPERLYLAHTLQLTEAQVKVWFQNRRIKWRKHHLELTHQRLAAIKQQQQQMHQQLLSEEPADTFDSSSGAEQDQDQCT